MHCTLFQCVRRSRWKFSVSEALNAELYDAKLLYHPENERETTCECYLGFRWKIACRSIFTQQSVRTKQKEGEGENKYFFFRKYISWIRTPLFSFFHCLNVHRNLFSDGVMSIYKCKIRSFLWFSNFFLFPAANAWNCVSVCFFFLNYLLFMNDSMLVSDSIIIYCFFCGSHAIQPVSTLQDKTHLLYVTQSDWIQSNACVCARVSQ